MTVTSENKKLVSVKNLSVEFDTLRGKVRSVDRLTFNIDSGETLGIVGESGCGKSVTSLAMMGLLPPTAQVKADEFRFNGRELLALPESELRQLRGGDMAMIFQEPMTSLNPSYTVGFQIMETLKVHQRESAGEMRKKTLELLKLVGISDVEMRFNSYPHQLSGGMCQRVMIAMAVACRPKLLIADEPTTALDVTIQSQILELLRQLQREFKMALILITHDIGVVAEMADRVMVMYAGQCVEMGAARDVIENPRHPYTQGLLQALPGAQIHLPPRSKLKSIPGLVPDPLNRPKGCQMNPRCEYATEKCRTEEPPMTQVGSQMVKCFFPLALTNPTVTGAAP